MFARPILHTASAVALGFGLTLAALAQQDTTAPPQVPAPQADAPALDPTSLPEVVARVNDEPIQRNALVSIAEGIVQQLRLTGQTPPPQDKAFYEEILDRLISSELVAQEGVSQGITISDADIDARIERLEQQAGGAPGLETSLAEQGMTRDELRSTIREDLIVQRYIEEKVAPVISVSDQEARTFYDQNQDQMQRPEQVHVRHILIEAGPEDPAETRAQAREKAAGLRQQIADGADFAALAREHSEDPGSREAGGDLGWIARQQTVPAFDAVAFQLATGTLSEVVETRFGFHVLRVEEKRPAGVMSFEEVQPRIDAFLRDRKVEEALTRKVEELEQKARVERFL